MAWNRSTVKVEDEKKSAKRYHAWHGLVAGLIVVAAAGAAVLGVSIVGGLFRISYDHNRVCVFQGREIDDVFEG